MWFNRLSFSQRNCLTLRYIYMFHRRDFSSVFLINNFEVVYNPLKAQCFRMFFFYFYFFFSFTYFRYQPRLEYAYHNLIQYTDQLVVISTYKMIAATLQSVCKLCKAKQTLKFPSKRKPCTSREKHVETQTELQIALNLSLSYYFNLWSQAQLMREILSVFVN